MKTFVSLATAMGLLLFSAEPVAAQQSGNQQCYDDCASTFNQQVAVCDSEYDIRDIDRDYCEQDAETQYEGCYVNCNNGGMSVSYIQRDTPAYRAVHLPNLIELTATSAG